MSRSSEEYKLCKAISQYLRLQYPGLMFHWDYAGLNLSRAQAGMMKGIQGVDKYPDLFIAEPKGVYHGLFLEVKHSKVKVFKQDGSIVANEHIQGQATTLAKLNLKGYLSQFAVGFDDVKAKLDKYMSL